MAEDEKGTCGLRGCSATIKRHGIERFCAQKAIIWDGTQGYCWYHNPKAPHSFGEGYRDKREAIDER